ncbi:MAG TPA: MFS transporter [Acidimicrobiales bacterium]|nr:MFS transporter [Acidimicrobiales bacterium]
MPSGSPVEAFRHRNFALFITGGLLSSVGSMMQAAVVPYVLFAATGSSAWAGFATFAQFVPSVVLGPLAGSLADRYPRRTVLLATQAASALPAFALWGVWQAGVAGPGLIVACVAAGGVVGALAIPSWQAFVSELVPRPVLLNAVTINSAQFNAARAVGPAMAGVVLARFGPSWAFLLNGLSFFVIVGALVLVEVPPTPRAEGGKRVMGQFADGLRYLGEQPTMQLVISLVFLIAFFGNPVATLLPALARRVLHVGPGAYGVLAASLGTGAVIGAVILGGLGRRWRPALVVPGAFIVYGSSLVVVGLGHSLVSAVLAMAMAGAAYLGLVSVLNTTVQLLVAEELRGRVMSVYVMAFTLGFPLGALVQGWLADRAGVGRTIVGAALVLIVLGIALLLSPRRTAGFDLARAGSDDFVLSVEPAE